VTLEIWLAYVTTVFVFLVSPGPSHIFMTSMSLTNGFGRSWATAAGDLTAHLWQITAASIGLVSLFYAFQEFFVIIKWAGVGFLIYLGIGQILKGPALSGRGGGDVEDRGVLFWKGFVTSSANPKAIVFFAALFPQFIDPAGPTGHQFVILGATYMLIDGCFLMFYGYFADWIAGRFERHLDRYLNRISGVLLIGAALLLGFKDMGNIG
jgi:threonine/homoserine/homoserine lactone efflux protein